MAFTGYTPEQADAIHQALINEHLTAEVDWPCVLNRVTSQIYDAVSSPMEVLYERDVAKRLATFIDALDATVQAHQKLGEPLQAHLDDQLFNAPLVQEQSDDSAHTKGWKVTVRCLLSSDQLPDALNAVRWAAEQAARHPVPYAHIRTTGAPRNYVMRTIVRDLLGLFEAVTGIRPKVYANEHATEGYAGNFYKFAVACLAPVRLVPAKHLGSGLLVAYEEWRGGEIDMQERLTPQK